MDNEIWVVVPETDGVYEVSNYGNVRSNDTTQVRSNGRNICTFRIKGKILKPYYTGKNPPYPTVQINGRNRKVHRLVAEAFIPNPDKLPEVNHIDGNKNNNRADNLEWVTTLDNSIHSHRNGLKPTGERVPGAKLTSEQVKEIRATYKPNTRGLGPKSLAKKFGVSDATIRRILSGKKWRYENGD